MSGHLLRVLRVKSGRSGERGECGCRGCCTPGGRVVGRHGEAWVRVPSRSSGNRAAVDPRESSRGGERHSPRASAHGSRAGVFCVSSGWGISTRGPLARGPLGAGLVIEVSSQRARRSIPSSRGRPPNAPVHGDERDARRRASDSMTTRQTVARPIPSEHHPPARSGRGARPRDRRHRGHVRRRCPRAGGDPVLHRGQRHVLGVVAGRCRVGPSRGHRRPRRGSASTVDGRRRGPLRSSPDALGLTEDPGLVTLDGASDCWGTARVVPGELALEIDPLVPAARLRRRRRNRRPARVARPASGQAGGVRDARDRGPRFPGDVRGRVRGARRRGRRCDRHGRPERGPGLARPGAAQRLPPPLPRQSLVLPTATRWSRTAGTAPHGRAPPRPVPWWRCLPSRPTPGERCRIVALGVGLVVAARPLRRGGPHRGARAARGPRLRTPRAREVAAATRRLPPIEEAAGSSSNWCRVAASPAHAGRRRRISDEPTRSAHGVVDVADSDGSIATVRRTSPPSRPTSRRRNGRPCLGCSPLSAASFLGDDVDTYEVGRANPHVAIGAAEPPQARVLADDVAALFGPAEARGAAVDDGVGRRWPARCATCSRARSDGPAPTRARCCRRARGLLRTATSPARLGARGVGRCDRRALGGHRHLATVAPRVSTMSPRATRRRGGPAVVSWRCGWGSVCRRRGSCRPHVRRRSPASSARGCVRRTRGAVRERLRHRERDLPLVRAPRRRRATTVDPFGITNALLLLEHGVADGRPPASDLVVYDADGEPTTVPLRPGELVVLADGGVVHSRRPVGEGERVILLSLVYV